MALCDLVFTVGVTWIDSSPSKFLGDKPGTQKLERIKNSFFFEELISSGRRKHIRRLFFKILISSR